MDPTIIANMLAIIAAVARQAEMWSRSPVDLSTEEGRRELAARHERVMQFMRLVQVEADELRRAP